MLETGRAVSAGLLGVLSGFIGLMPWKALRAAGSILGWIAGSVLRLRRRHVMDAMAAAGICRAPREVRAMYRSLGTSMMEFLWLAARGDRALEHVAVDPASERLWREALARGRGVVIAASHTGNWDLAACAMAGRGPLMVVTKRLSIKSIDAFWQGTRAGRGVLLAPPEDGTSPAPPGRRHVPGFAGAWSKLEGRNLDVATRALGFLGQGGAVAMMIDQVPGSLRSAARAEFLGRMAWVERGPAALAARARAPLVVAASRRQLSGEHTLHVLDVMVPPPRPGREWIESATAAATRALDAFVRAHPSQWLWLHRRWRSPRVDRGWRPAMLAPPCRIRSSSRASASQVA
jgi:KDO2-lipid IV(A) lauroyltransferase